MDDMLALLVGRGFKDFFFSGIPYICLYFDGCKLQVLIPIGLFIFDDKKMEFY